MPCRNALRSTPLLVENGNLVGKLSMSDGLGCLTRSGGRPSTPAVRIASTSRRVMFRSNAALLTGAAINQKQESFLHLKVHTNTQEKFRTPPTHPGHRGGQQTATKTLVACASQLWLRISTGSSYVCSTRTWPHSSVSRQAATPLARSLLWPPRLVSCGVECCAHWAAAGPRAILPLVGPRVRVLPVCGSRFEWECVHTGRGVVSHVVRQGGCAYICHI